MTTLPSDAAAAARIPNQSAALRPEALAVPESGIVELFNHGRGRQGLIPLWVGEGDLGPPACVVEAARKSLADGETFYTHQRGIPELRAAIAHYMTLHYGGPFAGSAAPFEPERFFVTIGGMHALQLAVRLTCGVGDDVIIPSPAWPNFDGVLRAAGARPVTPPLVFDESGASPRWRLDLEALAAAITPATRAMIINSPANPTGWIASHDDLRALLDIARRNGVWIIADEIYGRFFYEGGRAPSFHDVMDESDLVLFVQTFSKNWAMTGLRIGWLEAPPALGQVIENLIQVSSTGVATPIQRAGVAALTEGETFFALQTQRARTNRDVLAAALAATGRARFEVPRGAFYLFCAVDGVADTRALAYRLLDEAGVGVAPGTAFGLGGERFMRLCFARDSGELAEAGARLARWLRPRA
jgi:aspartate/methionine/tyrosine aminotransferase